MSTRSPCIFIGTVISDLLVVLRDRNGKTGCSEYSGCIFEFGKAGTNNGSHPYAAGMTLSGRIKSFDKFSVLLDVGGPDVLIFKHAISSISQERKRPPE